MPSASGASGPSASRAAFDRLVFDDAFTSIDAGKWERFAGTANAAAGASVSGCLSARPGGGLFFDGTTGEGADPWRGLGLRTWQDFPGDADYRLSFRVECGPAGSGDSLLAFGFAQGANVARFGLLANGAASMVPCACPLLGGADWVSQVGNAAVGNARVEVGKLGHVAYVAVDGVARATLEWPLDPAGRVRLYLAQFNRLGGDANALYACDLGLEMTRASQPTVLPRALALAPAGDVTAISDLANPVRVGDTWHAYMTVDVAGAGSTVGHASAPHPAGPWTAPEPVTADGAAMAAVSPCVVYDGTFHLYASADGNVAYFTSADGVAFASQGVAVARNDTWAASLSDPTVAVSSVCHMFACATADPPGRPTLAHATAPAPGGPWTLLGVCSSGCAAFAPDGLRGPNAECHSGRYYVTTSSGAVLTCVDGSCFAIAPRLPLLAGPTPEWPSVAHLASAVHGDQLYVFSHCGGAVGVAAMDFAGFKTRVIL